MGGVAHRQSVEREGAGNRGREGRERGRYVMKIDPASLDRRTARGAMR